MGLLCLNYHPGVKSCIKIMFFSKINLKLLWQMTNSDNSMVLTCDVTYIINIINYDYLYLKM